MVERLPCNFVSDSDPDIDVLKIYQRKIKVQGRSLRFLVSLAAGTRFNIIAVLYAGGQRKLFQVGIIASTFGAFV